MKQRKYIDCFFPDKARLWFRLCIGDGFDALYPISISQKVLGKQPEWWSDDDDIETIVSPGWKHAKYKSAELRIGWVEWARENGIAPGQPFQLEVRPPTVYKSGYECGEWDVEYDYAVRVVRHWPRHLVEKSWAHLQRRMGRMLALKAADQERHRLAAERDTGCMEVYVNFCGRYNDEISMRVRNTRPLYMHYEWGYAHGDQRIEKHLFETLVANACAHNRYLSPEIIRALPIRRN